jgi:hypothetical protein
VCLEKAEIQTRIHHRKRSRLRGKNEAKIYPACDADESSLPRQEFESMLTMSRAISAGQALDYYRQQFTNSKDNYYSESGEVKDRRSGRLASQSCWFRQTISAVKAAFVFYTK